MPPQPLVNAVPVQNVSGEPVPVTPVPGQTLVTMATATVTANNGQTVTIPVQGKEGRVGYRVLSLCHLLESYRDLVGMMMRQAFRKGVELGGIGNPCLENLVLSFPLCFFLCNKL